MGYIRKALAGAVLSGVVAAAGLTGTAYADSASARRALASYEGQVIDLSQSWQGAEVCAVYSKTDVRCFSSAEAANQAIGTSSSRAGAVEPTALADCQSGWLCLWDGTSYSGRRLQFNDEYWDNLTPYGFNDKTSSVYNRQGSRDSGGLGENDAGTGGWQDWYTSGARVSDLGSRSNQASSVHG